MQNVQNAAFLIQLTQQTIYLMGISFLLGSLFTIFVLLILDMVRAGREAHMDMLEEQRPYDESDDENGEDSGRHAA